jgi:hypothetical protein
MRGFAAVACALALAACGGGGGSSVAPPIGGGGISLSPSSTAQQPIQIHAGQSTSVTASESGFGGPFSVSGGAANCFTVAMTNATTVGISPTLVQNVPCAGSFSVGDGQGRSATGYISVIP